MSAGVQAHRVRRAILTSLLLGAAGLMVLVLGTGDLSDLSAVASLDPPALAISAALLLVSYLAGAARVLWVARLLGARIGAVDGFRAYLVGLFGAAVTPGGGGHAVAIGLALRRTGVPGSTAWSIAIYPTVIDLLFYAWALPVALVILGLTPEVGRSWHTWSAAPVGMVLLGGWFVLAFRSHGVTRSVGRLFSVRGLRRWRRRVWRFMRQLGDGIAALSLIPVSTQLLLQVTTATIHVAVNLILYVVASSLGAPIGVLPTLAIVMVVSAVSNVVPTPGASGYMELALGLVLTQQAAPGEVAPAVLTWRAFSFYASIAAGSAAAGSLASQSPSAHDAPTDRR